MRSASSNSATDRFTSSWPGPPFKIDSHAWRGPPHRVRLWRAATFDVDELDTERLRQATRDAEVVLGRRQRPVIDVDLLGPEVRTGARVDELRVDGDRAGRPA